MNDEIITSYLLGKKAGGGGTPPVYQDKEVSITQNGTTTITKDSGYDALSSVELTVAVPQPSGKINITQNGTDIDVSSYASADVNVGGSSAPTNLTELNTAINTTALGGFVNYLNSANSRKIAYTNNSKTFYTPDSTYKLYVILHLRTSNKYNIYWIDSSIRSINDDNSIIYNSNISHISQQTNIIRDANNNYVYSTNNEINFELSGNGQCNTYVSAKYLTLEDAISALESNETTYTYLSGYWNYLNFDEIYTNDIIFKKDSNNEWNIMDTKIISHNETIQVIS